MNDGRELKQTGQSVTIRSNIDWATYIRPVFDAWLKQKKIDDVFTMEDFRMHCIGAGEHLMPRSPNCWGAFATAMQREMRIYWTGFYAPARSAATHSHPIRLYQVGL